MKNDFENNILEQIIEEYWLNQFSEDLPATLLPIFNKSKCDIGRKMIRLPIAREIYEPLMKICKNSDMGFFMILFAALNSIFFKYGREETIIGTSSFTVEKKFIHNNLIFLRNTICKSKSFKESIGDIKKIVLDANKYQNYPMENLENKLRQQDKNVENLFHIALVSEKINEQTTLLEQFDFVITYTEKAEPSLIFSFKEEIYEENIINQFAKHFINYLKIIPKHINDPLSDIDILTDDDTNIIMNCFNDTKCDFPYDVVFQQLFEKQVQERPYDVAVECGEQKLSYGGLNAEANKLAHLLREKGVGSDSVVGICFERSIDMLVAILAIFKAGGAYIPIDADYPDERIKTILSESCAKFLITKTGVIAGVDNFYSQMARETSVEYIICMDSLQDIGSDNDIFRTHKVAACLLEEKDFEITEDMVFSYDGLNLKADDVVQRIEKIVGFMKKNSFESNQIGLVLENPILEIITCIALQKCGFKFKVLRPDMSSGILIKTLQEFNIKNVLSESKFIDKLDHILWDSKTLVGYTLLDDYVIEDSETEVNFREIWNMVAEDTTEDINDYGWSSSYTGEKFSIKEMNQYIENFKFKLQPHIKSDSRVLEIGCGHGLVCSNIAPQVGYYLATDLSNVIIEKNRKRAKIESMNNIEFQTMPAAAIGNVKEAGFDFVICSSAVHYFPNTLYLEQVINSAIHLLKDEGIIYLDDVMNMEKKAEFIESIRSYKKQHPYATVKLEWDSDLFVSREFFHILQQKYPEIVAYEISSKLGNIENELTQYRFDVMLKIKKNIVKKNAFEERTDFNEGVGLTQMSKNYTNTIKYSKNRWTLKDIEKTYPQELGLLCTSTSNPKVGEVIDYKIVRQYSTKNLEIINQPSDLSYVIYTSGSTGKAKGAMIEHVGMINHLYTKIHETRLSSHDIVLQNASHCFDISVWQFLSALVVGAKTVIYSNDLVLNPDQFIKQTQKDKVTILEVVPTYLGALLDILEYIPSEKRKLNKLRYVFVTGEALNILLVKRWFSMYPEIKMVNAYGPTEASDDITHNVIDKPIEEEYVSIGKPIQNLNIYIVDRNMNLCPIGVKGEICVSGIGVGRGYLNNKQKTDEVFMLDPFVSKKNIRMYKTGDLGVILHDGNIQFWGRKDYQVKIRGFRIELGEIENKLMKYNDTNGSFVIKNVAVIDKLDANQNKFLCAYIEIHGKFQVSEVKEYLIKYLPDYMIPSNFIRIDKMPLNSNGKINRNALASINIVDEKEHIQSRDYIEATLVKIWREVLNIEAISIDDDFFQIGGHSLKATQMISKVYRDLNVEVPLKKVFQTPTIVDLAKYIRSAEKSIYNNIPRIEEKEYYSVSSSQKRMFILNELNGVSTSYSLPAIFKISGNFDRIRFEHTIYKLIERHDAFRTYFDIVSGEIVQKVHKDLSFEIVYKELLSVDMEELTEKFIKPFDLRKAPLVRVELIKTNDKYILMTDMHHIIADGISYTVFIDDFMKLYNGEELEGLEIQYKDFSAWQNDFLESDLAKKQEEYWMNVFNDEIPLLNMPTDFERLNFQSFEGDRIRFDLDENLTAKLKNISEDTGSTIYMTLLSAINILLWKYSGKEDIIIGTPISGRNHSDLEKIIGVFVNTLALRNYPKSYKTYREFLNEVKDKALEAYKNQDYPFEKLVDKLNINIEKGRNHLFDVMFAMDNLSTKESNFESIKFEEYIKDVKVSKFDVTFMAIEENSTIAFTIEYCTKLFKKETILEMKKHFINILELISNNVDIKIQDISLISEQELVMANEKIEKAQNNSRHTIELNF